jgi:hypothetical protein
MKFFKIHFLCLFGVGTFAASASANPTVETVECEWDGDVSISEECWCPLTFECQQSFVNLVYKMQQRLDAQRNRAMAMIPLMGTVAATVGGFMGLVIGAHCVAPLKFKHAKLTP